MPGELKRFGVLAHKREKHEQTRLGKAWGNLSKARSQEVAARASVADGERRRQEGEAATQRPAKRDARTIAQRKAREETRGRSTPLEDSHLVTLRKIETREGKNGT